MDPEGKIKGKLRLTNKIWGYFFVENIFFKPVFFTFKRGVQINLMISLTWIRILIPQILWILIPSIRIHSLNKLISNLYWLTNWDEKTGAPQPSALAGRFSIAMTTFSVCKPEIGQYKKAAHAKEIFLINTIKKTTVTYEWINTTQF